MTNCRNKESPKTLRKATEQVQNRSKNQGEAQRVLSQNRLLLRLLVLSLLRPRISVSPSSGASPAIGNALCVLLPCRFSIPNGSIHHKPTLASQPARGDIHPLASCGWKLGPASTSLGIHHQRMVCSGSRVQKPT